LVSRSRGRSLIRSEHCNTIVVRWAVREKGVTLAGPLPSTLVDPIPVEFLRMEIKEVITGWGQEIIANPGTYDNHFYQTFIVLNYCRMLHDLHTGFPGSKLAGAEWAKANLDLSWSALIGPCLGWSARSSLLCSTACRSRGFQEHSEIRQAHYWRE
jgi:hypothetical protein